MIHRSAAQTCQPAQLCHLATIHHPPAHQVSDS